MTTPTELQAKIIAIISATDEKFQTPAVLNYRISALWNVAKYGKYIKWKMK